MEKICNYINGCLVAPKSGEYIKNISPVDGVHYSLIPNSTEDDVDSAVEAAKKAFINWGSSSKKVRFNWLMKLADAIDDCSEELIIAESYDNGKPEWLARKVDIPRCSENFRFFATAMLHHKTSAFDMDGEALNYTLNPPIGVAGCISPWNLPLYLLTWKIAPAIAVGNTVVAKPSEITPYTAYLFSKICQKINFPKGVINIIHGYGDTAGDAVVRKCDIISFTGGTKTGRVVAASAAKSFKKCSLELGGKNPSIVFKDCDFEKTIKTVLRSAFTNQGQVCLCGSRIFVEKDIYDKFIRSFVEKAKELKVGDPKIKHNDLGAIVSEAHVKNIIKHVDNALKKGAKIVCGGKRLKLTGKLSGGFYMSPTVLLNTKNSDPINQEEVFGPVVTIISFNNERELVELSNQTKYGLSASIFTNDVSKAHRLAAKIDSGLIWINSWLLRDLRIPFGGMKSSGVGRKGGNESLNFFTETKNICVKIENKD